MIVSPKYDDFVRELFRNLTVLRYFIRDILGLPEGTIRRIRIRNPYLRKSSRKKKLGIVDVLLELNDDTVLNIELQVKMVKRWDKRQLFYLAKVFVEDLPRGEDYSNLKKTIGISLLDFPLNDRKTYHTVYLLRDEDGNVFSDILQLHIIELGKELAGEGQVEDWIRFFNVETEEDLKMIEAKTRNPGIQEAIQELRQFSLSRLLKARYEEHLKQVRDERAREEYVREEGEAKGREEGRAEGELSTLGELVEEGILTIEEAAKRKDMTKEEFQKKLKALRSGEAT